MALSKIIRTSFLIKYMRITYVEILKYQVNAAKGINFHFQLVFPTQLFKLITHIYTVVLSEKKKASL